MDGELRTVLPLLRERTVYVKDDGSGSDNSDYINKSFKGILRLSPNDSSSYLEMDNYISYNEVTADYISFEDNITNQLNNQFIRVSTSDGYLLDMRVSNEGVEYDNLYIQGAAHCNEPLNLYTTDSTSFALGGAYIVSERNKKIIIGDRNTDQYSPVNDDTLDDTYILVNNANNGMEFVNAKNVIDLFIKEALLELAAVPTGSVQFIPVSIEQYQALLKNSKGHNKANTGNDSLIRDYLLCDGSYYRVEDFPELAKILLNEKITLMKPTIVPNTDDNSVAVSHYSITEDINTINELKVFSQAEEDENGEPVAEEVRVFRVPDLRTMFIQSVVPGINSSENTGDFVMDSAKDPEMMIKGGLDNHYHYMVLDSPHGPQKNTNPGQQSKIVMEPADYPEGEYDRNSYARMPAGCKPAALARFGGIVSNGLVGRGQSCGKCCRSCYFQEGGSAIYRPTDDVMGCILGGPGGGYILSTISPLQNKGLTRYDWLGSSSWTIDMTVSKEDILADPDLDNNINYTRNPDDPVYNGEGKPYVQYDSDEMKLLLGYENTPEYYAVLPLIKI